MTYEQNDEILVLGGVTHENRGDLAMIDGLLTHLSLTCPDSIPILYSWNPEVSRRKFQIECRSSPDPYISSQFTKRSSRTLAIIHIAWFLVRFIAFRFISYRVANLFTSPSLMGFFAQLSRARAVVIHGSGSFNSYWWHDWVYPKTACSLAARISGKPVLLTSQGVGPFENILDKYVASLFFRTASFLGVRDAGKSSEIMLQLGAQADHIWQTGDDALQLPQLNEDEASTLLNTENLNCAEVLIGVNLRDASAYSSAFSETGIEKVATSLATVAGRYKARLVFIPISYDSFDDDRESAAKVVSMIGDHIPVTFIRNKKSAAELREIISHMHICVGVSYHFLLFSLSANVPAIGLFRNNYYRQKQTGLFDLFNQTKHCVDIMEANVIELTEIISQLIVEHEAISSQLKKTNFKLTETARNARAQFVRIANQKLPR